MRDNEIKAKKREMKRKRKKSKINEFIKRDIKDLCSLCLRKPS